MAERRLGKCIASLGQALSATKVTVISGSEQFVGLAFTPALPAGKHRLTLAFEAEQSRNSTRGIFALQDGDAWYAMTQFEPVSARARVSMLRRARFQGALAVDTARAAAACRDCRIRR
jgi:hypothetical protein